MYLDHKHLNLLLQILKIIYFHRDKMFNFQNSQLTQNEFEKLADLLLRYPKVYATSKFYVGKN